MKLSESILIFQEMLAIHGECELVVLDRQDGFPHPVRTVKYSQGFPIVGTSEILHDPMVYLSDNESL